MGSDNSPLSPSEYNQIGNNSQFDGLYPGLIHQTL